MPRILCAVDLLAGGIALLLLAASPVMAAPAVDLLSHRAAYRLSLAQADSGSGLAQVRGGLVLEWRADCDGWLSQQRLGFVAESDDGPGFTYDVRFSSWESRDSTQLRFNVRSFDGPKLQEEFRGLAKLDGPGRQGRRPLQRARAARSPSCRPVRSFPTEHVSDLITAARAGEHVLSREVFDGSGEDALTRATAVIGARQDGEAGRTAARSSAGRSASPISPPTRTTCCRSSRSRSTCRPAACSTMCASTMASSR